MAFLSDATKQFKANFQVFSPDYWTYNIPAYQGFKYGGFHYKYLEKGKVNTLKKSKCSFDEKMLLP